MKRQRHKRPSKSLKTCYDSLREVSERANRLTAENEALTLALLVMGEMWRRDYIDGRTGEVVRPLDIVERSL